MVSELLWTRAFAALAHKIDAVALMCAVLAHVFGVLALMCAALAHIVTA